MRLQLTAVLLLVASSAHADDRSEVSTSLFAEQRDGGKGGLVVVHPQALLGFDLGSVMSLDLSYAADIVSGATSTVYQADAVSSATTFSDMRNEGSIGIGFAGKRSKLVVGATFGAERDYLTRQLSAAATIDLPGRNTTVGLAYSHSFDAVCDRDNAAVKPIEARALTGGDACDKGNYISPEANAAAGTVWRDVAIDTAQVTLTQNLSPTSNMQLALYGQILEGFQSNPYRRVRIGSNSPQEHIPDTRARWSSSLRVNKFLPKLRGAVHAGARFYNDTWRIFSGDLELGYSQYVGNSILLKLYTRIYQQTAASFFKDAFFYQTASTAGEYWTGDRELAALRNGVLGAKLTIITIADETPVWKLFDKLQVNVKAEVLALDLLPADDPAMNVAGIDGQFIYGNRLVDSVTLQIGLLGSY